jgi:HAD superfamily hydrolase (TIGR01509 family)
MVLTLAHKPGAALLFDIDGTLCDSDVLHLQAFNAVFAPYGHTFDEARFGAELQGFANVAIAERFLAPLSLPEREKVMSLKEATFRELAGQGLQPLPGLLELMDAADGAGIPMAAVTNAPRLNAELMLGGLGLTERFRTVVIGEELARGKPDPLPYLEGLRRLGADAALSVAFEDSRTGIASATGAGLRTVGMMTGLGEEALLQAGAVLAVHDYSDVRLLALVA